MLERSEHAVVHFATKGLTDMGVMVNETIIPVPAGHIKQSDWTAMKHWTWRRHQYRLSDDTADNIGHPYLVAYLSDDKPTDIDGHCFHFYKWQTRGEVVLMRGDESGNDYGFNNEQSLLTVMDYFGNIQGYWCRKYHDCEHPPEREVPTNYQSISELITGLAARSKPRG